MPSFTRSAACSGGQFQRGPSVTAETRRLGAAVPPALAAVAPARGRAAAIPAVLLALAEPVGRSAIALAGGEARRRPLEGKRHSDGARDKAAPTAFF